MFFSSVRICPFHPFQPVRVDLEVCQFLSENSRGCSMPVNWQFCLRCYVSFRGCTFGQTLKTQTWWIGPLKDMFLRCHVNQPLLQTGWGSRYLGRFVYYNSDSIFYLKSTLGPYKRTSMFELATRSHLIFWCKPWTTCNRTFCRLTRRSHSAKPSHVKPHIRHLDFIMGCLGHLVYSFVMMLVVNILGSVCMLTVSVQIKAFFLPPFSVTPHERLTHRHWFGLFYGKFHPTTGFHCDPGVLFDGTSTSDFE